jgi:predicted  nucleic acid-binding Zn-ribbon protein
MDHRTELAVVIQRLDDMEARLEEFRAEYRMEVKESRGEHTILNNRITDIETSKKVLFAWIFAAVLAAQFLMGAGKINLWSLLGK